MLAGNRNKAFAFLPSPGSISKHRTWTTESSLLNVENFYHLGLAVSEGRCVRGMEEDKAVPDSVEWLLSTDGLQPPWG